MLDIDPSHLEFRDVQLNQAYTSSVRITNPLTVTLEFTVRPSSSKYTIVPNKIVLSPGQSIMVSVRLFVSHYSNYAKGVDGQKDAIQIKSPYFEQKISTIFFLKAKDSSISSSSTNISFRSRSASPLPRSITETSAKSKPAQGSMDNPVDELMRQIRIKDSRIKQLEEIVSELESKYPSLQKIVNTRIEQERINFEEKSMKILKILHKKDDTIKELQDKLESVSRRLENLQAEMKDRNRQLASNSSDSSHVSSETSKIISRLNEELESARARHEQDARRIYDLEIKLEDALSSPPPPPPLPVGSKSRSQEIQVLREQNLDQAEQIQILVSELSKLRADNVSTKSDRSDQQQTIEYLQNELKHQRERFDDLKSAFESLERVKLSDASHSANVERNIEGGYSTSTPFQLASGVNSNVEKSGPALPTEQLLRDRTAQLELYQERAETAEKSLEDLRSQLASIIKAEAPMKTLTLELQSKVAAQQHEIEEYGKQVLKLTEEKDALLSQLEDRDYQLSHSKRKADTTADQDRARDAHSWWSYVWHETKRLQSFAPTATDNDTLSSHNKYKEIIRNQAIELANARQELIGKKLVYQREISALREQLDCAERETNRLNQQLRNQRTDKDIKLTEMSSTIRILSQRGELQSVVVGVRQELEAERIANHHLKSEIESYQSIVDSQQLQISSLRKDISILKATVENLEIVSSISNIPGADAASVIEAMSGNFIHLQLELSKARSATAANQNQLEAIQKTIKLSASSTNSSPEPSNKKSVGFTDLGLGHDENLALPSSFATAALSVEEKDPRDQLPNFHLPSNVSAEFPTLASKPTTLQLLDNLDAALLAQKILAQESTIASLQSQLLQQRQIIEQIEQQRIDDRDSFERNDRIAFESQQQQLTLLQQAYNNLKEELEVSRKKLVDSDKKLVDLQSAVAEQDLYHRAISESVLQPFSAKGRASEPSHQFKPPNHEMENVVNELDHTKHLLRERTTQLKVLMETMDSLQLAEVVNESSNTNVMTASLGSQSWANQALIKRVVELSADLTSSNATIAQNDRLIHQLQNDLRWRGNELNSLKIRMKDDEDALTKMEQHVTALTSQLKDSEKLRLEENMRSQEELQKVTDSLKSATLTTSTLTHKLEELQQQLNVYESNSSNKEFMTWLENMIFDSTHPQESASSSSSFVASTVEPVAVSNSEIRDLIVHLLEQMRNDTKFGETPSSENLAFGTIGKMFEQPEQHFLKRATDFLLAANEKCIQASLAQQNARQETNFLKQRLSMTSKRLENAVKHIARYRLQLGSSRKLLVSQQRSLEYHHSQLILDLRKLLSNERDHRFAVTSELAALKKKLDVSEIERYYQASQVRLLTAKMVELEALRSPVDTFSYLSEEKIKQTESSLQSWFNVELPRLITGLPVTEDAFPTTFGPFESQLPVASRLTRDLGLDRTFALAQALCASKAANAALELKYTTLSDKVSSLQERNIDLEGIIMRWKQEIEYVHRIRNDGSLAFERNARKDFHVSERDKVESDLLSPNLSKNDEDVVELKGRLDFALQRLEQHQLYINELTLEESGLQQESAEHLTRIREQIQCEYDIKLRQFKEEFAQAHADDMKILEELVQEAKKSTSSDPISFLPSAESKENHSATVAPQQIANASSTKARKRSPTLATREVSCQVEALPRGRVKMHVAGTQTNLSSESYQERSRQDKDETSKVDTRGMDYERLLESEQLRYMKSQNEIQELQQLLTFQRQLLDEKQQQLLHQTAAEHANAIATANSSTAPMDEYIIISPINQEIVLNEDHTQWKSQDMLLDDIIDSLQHSLSQPLSSSLAALIRDATLNAIRVRKLFRDHKVLVKDRSVSPIVTTSDDAFKHDYTPITDSIQQLTSRVRELESHISAMLYQLPDPPSSSSSSSQVSIPEQYLYILRDLRIRVSDLEKQYLIFQDDLVRQQQSLINKATSTVRLRADEAIATSEKRAEEEINRLKSENVALREQYNLILKSHEEQIRNIRQRYELSLSQAQDALSSQTTTAKEEIQRLSLRLSQISETMSTAIDMTEYRAVREESQRYKSSLMETSRDLEIARDQLFSQQQLYLKQLQELKDSHSRYRRDQEEMIHELELRLEDAIRSNKTSMPSLKQAPSPRSNQPADDVLTDRIRRLEYKYLVKSAELDAVMRSLSRSAEEVSSIAKNVASGLESVKGRQSTGDITTLGDDYASKQLRLAEEEISSLNKLLAAERDVVSALKMRVDLLQQENDSLLQSLEPAVTEKAFISDRFNSIVAPVAAAVERPDDNRPTETATQTAETAQTLPSSPLLSPLVLKDVLASVEGFLQQTSADLVFPYIQAAGNSNIDPHPSQRAVHVAVTGIVNEIQDKAKTFTKRVNDMRRHARAELIRMRDLVVQAHTIAMEQINNLESQLKELKAQNASYRDENTRKGKLLSTLKASRAADSATMTQLQQDLKDAEESLRRLNRSVVAKESLIKTLKSKNQQLEESLEQMTTALGPTAAAVTADLGNIPLSELKSKLRLAEQERVRNRQRILGFKDKINELESENKAVKEEIDQLHLKQDRLDGLRSIISKKDAIIARLKDEATAAAEDLDQIRSGAQRQQLDHERRRRELENELASLRRTVVELEKENSLLRIRVGAQSQAMIATNISTLANAQSKPKEQMALPEVLSSSARDINDVMHALGKTTSASPGSSSPEEDMSPSTQTSVEQRLKALVRAALETKTAS